jgi:hypothetical protein
MRPGCTGTPERFTKAWLDARTPYVHRVVVVDGEVITSVSARRGRFRVVLRRGHNSLINELSELGVEVKFETTPLGLI